MGYKHLKFRVRMYPSFLGRAKTEWIVTLIVSDAKAETVKPPCIRSHVEMFVCLSCLLQTNYNCGTSPRGPTSFQDPSSVNVKKHDILVQRDTIYVKHKLLISTMQGFSHKSSQLLRLLRNSLNCATQRLINTVRKVRHLTPLISLNHIPYLFTTFLLNFFLFCILWQTIPHCFKGDSETKFCMQFLYTCPCCTFVQLSSSQKEKL